MIGRKAVLLVIVLLLVLQFLIVSTALTLPAVRADEPPAIPDSPYIESLTPNQPYNNLVRTFVTEAFGSSLGSCDWNIRADVNFDNVVNIYDAIIVSVDC